MKIEFVTFDEVFLDQSWNWLNDPEIKELTNTPNFSKESQLLWFDTINSKNDYLIWGIMADSNPIGVCGLKNITDCDCEYWGYIGEKDYWGKGIGKIVMQLLEKEASFLNLKSIWLQVLESNKRAQNLYTKMGYYIEEEKDSLIFMRKKV